AGVNQRGDSEQDSLGGQEQLRPAGHPLLLPVLVPRATSRPRTFPSASSASVLRNTVVIWPQRVFDVDMGGAPFLRVGYRPSPRVRPRLHSLPQPSFATLAIYRPNLRLISRDQGKSWKPSPWSIIAKRPE